MLTLIAIAAAVYLISLVFMARAVRRAPDGFEDNQGFHAGRAATVETLERREQILSAR